MESTSKHYPSDSDTDLLKKSQGIYAFQSTNWSWSQTKAVLVAGSGFLTESYDNFVLALVVPMLGYIYYPKSNGSLPIWEDSWLKSSSSWGSIIGQLVFGYLADLLGRRKMYGVELIVLIIGICGSALAGPMRGMTAIAALSLWRLFIGCGLGGDCPMTASITSEFAGTNTRGQMMALVFSTQILGIVMGAAVSLFTLSIYHDEIVKDIQTLDTVWRILIGFAITPGLFAVYFRLTIPESPRFTHEVTEHHLEMTPDEYLSKGPMGELATEHHAPGEHLTADLLRYFGKWSNMKILIGTSLSWFFLDIALIGVNVNSAILLDAIGYADMSSPYNNIWSISVGTLIVNCFGHIPGFIASIFLVEKLGRKPIQNFGFLFLTIIFAVMALFYESLRQNTTVFMILFCGLEFFFNFGPNTTTFIIPAEVFPTRIRTTAHGISAAMGKLGGLVGLQFFTPLANIGGENANVGNVMWIFSISCLLGLLVSLWIPETAGLSLEELADIYNDKSERLEKLKV
ncbi:phosphate:H+ symporter [Globomyces pollinis-pini]|nr:phosphate:H+ symporter [Globomyces pollinis-pini]KAJ2995066.1 phosphate transporter [Globomyces sp. JEL0801]